MYSIVVESERQHATVVVRIRRMWNRQQHRLGGIGDVRIRRHSVLGNHERAVSGARVEHEEAAVRWIEWMERQAKESSLAAGEDSRADVEKNRRRR